ncbi:hypothetical protein ACIGHN_13250 [Acidovorax sp. NPDC077693]|uniref:hypothetical protein n=1 Tax=unclassified Acidovorax TaxID=2684926 RepID=UPI0037C68BB9
MFNWLKKKNSAGPDFSALDSNEKVKAAAAAGQLVPMLLMPEEFGGPREGMNVVYVPAWAAEQKRQIDLGTVIPLAQQGTFTKYAAEPKYKGNSFVPSAITVRAHEPGDFTATVDIW